MTTTILANAPRASCSPRPFTTLGSFRKLALSGPGLGHVCSSIQNLTLVDLRHIGIQERNSSSFGSSFSRQNTRHNEHDLCMNSSRTSSIMAIPCATVVPCDSMKDLLRNEVVANRGVAMFPGSPAMCENSVHFGWGSLSFSYRCPASATIRWSRRTAPVRCLGSTHRILARNGSKGRLINGRNGADMAKEERLPSSSTSSLGGRSAPSAVPFDNDMPELLNESDSKSLTSPSNESSRVGFEFGIDRVTRNEDSLESEDRIAEARGRARAWEVKGQNEEYRKKAAFEKWAIKKLKEDGPSALSTIEEMRRTFAPGSAKLDIRVAFNEIESQRNDNNIGRYNKPHSEKVHRKNISVESHVSDFQRTDSEVEGASMLPGGAKGPPPSHLRKGDESSVVAASDKKAESPLPKTILTRGRVSKDVTSDRNLLELSVGGSGRPPGKGSSGNSGGVNAAANSEPLLVKRSTKFSVDWNGLAGTVMLVDKPQGWTSFAVCGKLRYLLKIQKVGHAGTLDPMATGLLIVCLGKATKIVDRYQAMTKVYSGTIRLGELTPSLDACTEVSDVLPWEHITDEDLERASKSFIGEILQKPPMYSAIKINGERLYKKARRGEDVDIPARVVSVTELKLKRSPTNMQEVHFTTTCSKGTYVRSLCADLAVSLGSYAHLTALRREKIGTYSVKDAWPILEFQERYLQMANDVASGVGGQTR